MKLTNNRYYFDFNATSPLAQSVKDWLAGGDFSFANPSSIHSSGKAAKREIKETTEFLYRTFGLSSHEHQLFYHSGASEGINQIVKGHAKALKNQGEKLYFFYAGVDHSCILNQVGQLENEGHKTYELPVNDQGELLWDRAYEIVQSCKGEHKLINLTWVNNETGVVWPLDKILELKKQTRARVHVDAVQSIGKIENWNQLKPEIDAYTFSGHKFGALKGVGASFMSRSMSFEPLIVGGGQQFGLRAGTQNTMGITSLRLAMQELLKNQNIPKAREAKLELENELIKLIGDSGEVFGFKAQMRNATTLCFGLKAVRADILATAFDLAGVDVSTGSACSSGTVNPSRVLLAMGYDDEMAKSVLRLSFSPYLNKSDSDEFSSKILPVVKRFLE